MLSTEAALVSRCLPERNLIVPVPSFRSSFFLTKNPLANLATFSPSSLRRPRFMNKLRKLQKPFVRKAAFSLILPRKVFSQTPRCIRLAANRFLVFNVRLINRDYRSAKLILADRADSLYENADFSVKNPNLGLKDFTALPFSYPINYSHLTKAGRFKSSIRFVTFLKHRLLTEVRQGKAQFCLHSASSGSRFPVVSLIGAAPRSSSWTLFPRLYSAITFSTLLTTNVLLKYFFKRLKLPHRTYTSFFGRHFHADPIKHPFHHLRRSNLLPLELFSFAIRRRIIKIFGFLKHTPNTSL